jgi:branched-chain amino acid transport system substrate-binding protein
MKSRLFPGGLAVVLALAGGVAACGGSSGGSASGGGGSGGGGLPSTIKIGVPFDTSGSAAIAGVGTAELAGVKLGADEINSTGFLGKSKLQLDVQDTKADKQQSVATVRQMVGDKVDAIVGFTLTPSFLAAGPLAQQSRIPTMSVGLSADGVTDVGDYVFRIYPSLSRLFASSDPQFLKQIGAKTAAFIYGNDTQTTVGQYQFRKKEVADLGIKSVSVQTVTADDTDVRAQLTQIKNAHPDVLFLNVNTGQQPGILTQAKELGILPQTPLIGDVGFGNATVLEQAGDALQCAMFATTYTPDSDTPENKHFVDLYAQKNGGKEADDFGAWGYDAIWAMARAIKAAGSTDADKIRSSLSTLKMNGALGDYSFDKTRQPTQSGVLLQVDGGKLKHWTPDSTCTR